MKKEKELSNEEEIERLKWEYLMASPDFMDCWKAMRETRKDPSIPLPDKYNRGVVPRAIYTRESYFLRHDPKESSFESYCGYKNAVRKKYTKELVEDYRLKIIEDIDIAVDHWKSVNEAMMPTIEQLKYYLESLLGMNSMNNRTIYLKITRRDGTKKEAAELKRQIGRIIDGPPADVRFRKELRIYLDVYRAKMKNPKMHWKEIAAILPEYKDKENWKSTRVQLDQAFNKAIKIIRNVEMDVTFWWRTD